MKMDAILKRTLNYFPKYLTNSLQKCIKFSANDCDSFVICFLLCCCKRLLLLLFCLVLLVYDVQVKLMRFVFGRWLLKLQVVPFETQKCSILREDPGVKEMHALLRGEGCCCYESNNLSESQRRPALPPDFDPYDEFYLASYYCKLTDIIIRLIYSLKQHDSPFSHVLNTSFNRFDERVINHFKSVVLVNKRE